MTEADDELTFAVDDRGVATIRLCRPHALNALTSRMSDDLLPSACMRATKDPKVRVVVITGSGRGFCSGADVDARIPEVTLNSDSTALERPIGNFAAAVWAIPKPVIAAVNGVAAGGGMALATLADFRIVASSATFVPAFIRRGLMPDSGLTYTLPRIVGTREATRLLMTDVQVDATEALRIGLADQVAPDEVFDQAVSDFAGVLAAGPAVALSFTKRALAQSARSSFSSQLEFESWGQHVCFKTADFEEGIAAFRDHREPKFTGR
jgi:2-(1,2-epoxy-1,2-dihydrophenyl)acetyl-CoA isomerase